jgi:VanZ family protein
MKMIKGEWLLVLFNLLYIIGFTAYYVSIRNYEFLGYIGVMVLLFVVIFAAQRKIKFSYSVLWLLTGWGILHMVGGGVIINGGVAYKLELIPLWVTENFYVLKYDQFVHAYLYFVMIFVIWHLLKDNLGKSPNYYIIYPSIALISIGIGGLNEIVEFVAVLFLEQTGVGGYYNTAWDIVFNTLGAVLGMAVLWFRNRKLEKSKIPPHF